MKNLVSAFAALMFGLALVQAQNPYAALGIEEQVLHYDDTHKEMFDSDTIRPIGYALYSVKDGLLTIFDLHDSLVSAHKIDPSKVARWLSVDPLAGEYTNLSPYAYVANNPIIAIDPDGQRILFVNGHYQDNWVGRNIVGSDKGGQAYWGAGFSGAAQRFFNDNTAISNSNFIDGSSSFGGDMSGADRYNAGYAYAKANLGILTADMVAGETFKMVTHSEGAAYGAGLSQYLLDQGFKVETIVHLSADEGDEFSTPSAPNTYQLGYAGDWVTGNKAINGVDKSGLVNSGLGFMYVHGSTRNAGVFDEVSDLKTVNTQDNIGMVNGKAAAWKTQIPGTTPNGTDFTKINGIGIMNQDGTPKKQ
jgi:hypothetical protein